MISRTTLEKNEREFIINEEGEMETIKKIHTLWSSCWAIALDRSEDKENDELLDALEKLYNALGLKVLE